MSFQLFLQHIRSGGKILAGWRQEELEEKTAGTGSVSSAVCDNIHIGRLEAGCKLVLYPAVKEQLWWRCIYMQMKRTTQRQSRGEVSLEIILNPGWWRRQVSRLKEDLKQIRDACWIVCIWWTVKISHLTGILQLFFSPKCEFVSLRPFNLLKIPQMKMVSCYNYLIRHPQCFTINLHFSAFIR